MKNPFKRYKNDCKCDIRVCEGVLNSIKNIDDYLEKESTPHEHVLQKSDIQIFTYSVAYHCVKCDYKTSIDLKDMVSDNCHETYCCESYRHRCIFQEYQKNKRAAELNCKHGILLRNILDHSTYRCAKDGCDFKMDAK